MVKKNIDYQAPTLDVILCSKEDVLTLSGEEYVEFGWKIDKDSNNNFFD